MPESRKKPNAKDLIIKIKTRADFDYAYDLAMFQILITTIIGIGILLLQQNGLNDYTILALIIALGVVFITYEWRFRGYKKKLDIEDV